MSTPDKAPAKTPAPSSDGVNAYKINRSGLQPPSPKARAQAEERAPQPPPAAKENVPSPSRGRLLAAFGLAALAVVLLALWALRDRGARATGAGGGVASEASHAQSQGERVTAALPTYRALVIGINQYQGTGAERWQPLNTARADAEAVASALSKDYGFQVQTLLDGEASRSAILSAMDEMATSGADGADLIYFAGHGYYDEKLQEGYWIPADARKSVDGRQAKEDWLWNSTITRLIGASRARHVLVLSDACYSGSLFRGDEPLSVRGSASWYERAIAKPSRYLITSGGLEPVLDSGVGHSVFAQQILNFLGHGDRSVFSANDLGLALRERVAALTGQMVQMGPLPVSGHAGGEFVFVRRTAGAGATAFVPQATPPAGGETRGTDPAAEAKARQEALLDAAALTRAGAPKAANNLVSAVLQRNAQDQLAQTVADYIARTQRQESRDELRALISHLEAKGKGAAAKAAPAVRPRVLACLGPSLPAGVGGPAAEGGALLYRIALRSELETRSVVKIIEREALETLLQEQNLGVSDVADPRARLAVGKLLPASLLLLGDVLSGDQGDRLLLRLVDTETTQVLASFSVTRKADEPQEKLCAELAGQIADRIAVLKPLLVPVAECEGARLRAGVGSYHGVKPGVAFTVLRRTLRDKKTPDDFIERELGTATVRSASEFSSELEVAWSETAPSRADEFWLRERPPAKP